MKVVSSKQMKTIEKKALCAGISEDELMENAGFTIATRVYSYLNPSTKPRVFALIGPGNNGGDGLVASRILYQWKIPVVIYLGTSTTHCKGKYQQCLDLKIPVIIASNDPDQKTLSKEILNTDILLDALFGAGSTRRFDHNLQRVLNRINEVKQKSPRTFQIISVDIPSGINPDNGSIPTVALSTDVTLALGAPKIGLFRLPGSAHSGKLESLDIGIPEKLFNHVRILLLDKTIAENNLPPRSLHSSKRSFGKVLIVAGSQEYIGAARLATLAAYRSGSGLVTLATPRSVYELLSPTLPEATYQPLPESTSGRINEKSVSLIHSIIHRYDALLIGCGLGLDDSTIKSIESLICNSAISLPPTVLDADGINCLEKIPKWWERIGNPMVLTPHHGEMMRLTGIKEINDPLKVALSYAKSWKKTVVLKGPITIIASPNGSCKINAEPNPLLSTAGTGDILAGITVALVGQGLDLSEAAATAVYVHSKAAKEISVSIGDGGMLASDLIDQIPKTIATIRGVIRQNIV